jgi:G3E family GTPase
MPRNEARSVTAADGRMRLTLVGGFLGSGKSTWLRHQLHQGTFRDAFVIVNEAADVPVDDVLLQDSSRLAVLSGGCACCDKKGELLTLLRGIADAKTAGWPNQQRFDDIVIETSGLADPAAIADGIRTDPVLVHHVRVAEIIVAVDAVYGLEQLRLEPLGRRQMEVADTLVVTKVDMTGSGEQRRLMATLRAVNPAAAMVGAVKGEAVALPAFAADDAAPLPGADAATPRPPVFATSIALDAAVDWTAFSIWLSALLHARGEDILRVKGIVRTPAGRLLLQSVRRTVQPPEILPDDILSDSGTPERGEDNTIVIIGRGYAPQDLLRSLRHFAGIDPPT